MRARIVKINDKTVVIKGNNGKFATVAKSKLQFRYQLGDYIVVEKDDDKLYFLPDSKIEESEPTPHGHIDDSFLDDKTPEAVDSSRSSHSLIAAIISIVLAVVGWFFAFYVCLVSAIAITIFAFSNLKHSGSKRDLVVILLVINIVIWLVEIGTVVSAGGL